MEKKEKKEKKRRGRRWYLADFHQTASGKYVYGGDIYRFDGPGSWKEAMTLLWALAAAMLAAVITAGCVPAAGIVGAGYVTLPYALSLVCALSVVWLMGRWTIGGPALRDYVYRATVCQVKLRGWVTVGFTAVTLIGEMVYLILHGWGGMMAGTVALIVALVVELVTVTVWTLAAGRLCWSK